MSKTKVERWGILWRSECILDGKCEHLLWDRRDHNRLAPALFLTRREARVFQQREYGYIHHRPDLRREPHGWKSPKVVRVACTFEVIK